MPRPYCLRRGEGTPPYDLPEKGFVGRPALRPPQRGEGAPPDVPPPAAVKKLQKNFHKKRVFPAVLSYL